MIDSIEGARTWTGHGVLAHNMTPEQAAAAARGGGVEIVASHWLGGARTQDRLWERLRIGGDPARDRLPSAATLMP
jgi:hypothetical protein